MDTPDDWKGSTECVTEEGPTDLEHWWDVFDDPQLAELEEEAVTSNYSLLAALQRVMQARAIAGVDRSSISPQLTLNPRYQEIDTLFKLYLPGSGFNFPGLGALRRDFRVQQFLYSLPFNLSWELDLWGKLRGQYDSAKFNAEAELEALRATLLSLTTDLATSYYQLRSLDAQIVLLADTRQLRQESLDLAQNRFDKGLISYSDVANATLALSNVESELFDTQRQRTLQENIIALLIGRPASEFCLPPLPLFSAPPCIPPGVPAEILLQRPDLAQLEREMASQHALIGVAYASFFPSVKLTSTLGFFSPEGDQFMTWRSRYFSWITDLAQPIFDGWRNCSNLRLAWARFGEADDNYREQVLVAFREVEDALNNLDLQAKQSQSLDIAVEAASTVAKLAKTRNQKGLVSYIEVIDGQRQQLDAQRNQLNLLGVRYVSTVQLIKALGGTWSSCAGQ